MQKFRVSFWYDVRATVCVKANTAEEAEKLIVQELEANGMEEVEPIHGAVKEIERDYGVGSVSTITTKPLPLS